MGGLRAVGRAIPPLLSCLALAAAEAEPAKRPLIAVEAPVHDWGSVYRGEEVVHTFRVSNRGEAPLVVDELKPHCGCTTVDPGAPTGRAIPPGDTVEVTLRLDSSLLRGTVEKEVEIVADAPGDRQLWMKGEVVDLLEPDPSTPKVEIVRGALLPTKPTILSLRAAGPAPVTVESIAPTKGLLRAKVEEVEEGRAWRLELEPAVPEDGRSAFLTEALEARTVVGGRKVDLKIQVSVALRDRIDVLPSKSVYFSRATGTAVTKSLEVRSIAGPTHSFRVTAARSKAGHFGVEVEPVEAGRAYRLSVRVLGAPREGKRFLGDTIEVETDDPLVPLLKIPASAQF